MTLNQISYRIFEAIRPELTDDDSIDIREIKYDVCTQRALWIKNESNKNREVNSSYIQDLGCVELEISDTGECCDISTGCKILRTKLDIPKPIELYYGELITRVGPVDKLSINYNYIPYLSVPFVGNGRFNKYAKFVFYRNNKLYIFSRDSKIRTLKYLNIQGVFYDPRLVSEFTTCSGTSCYTDDMEFPLAEYLIPYIEGEIIKKYAGVEIKLPGTSGQDNSGNLQVQTE